MNMLVNEIMEFVSEIGKMLYKEKEEVSYILSILSCYDSHPVNSVYTQSVTIRQPVMVLLRVCIGGLAKCLGDVARCIGFGVRDLVLSCFVRKI